MKKIIIATFFALLTVGLSAQSIWNMTYNISVSAGETNEFISKASFRGFGIDGRGFVTDNLTLGGAWSWNVFYESNDNVTTTEGSVTVTGNHYNYGNYMPLMFTSHYYFGEDGYMRPFIGTGIGTIWKEEIKDIGAYNSFTDNAWQFGFTPEVGVYVPVASGSMLFLSAKYTYGVQTGELRATSYFNFGIGFAWESY